MKKVNIIIGRFQPFTKGHYKCIEEAWRLKQIPTVICMIDTPDNKVDERHPFPSTLLLPIYKDQFKRDSKVEDIVLIKNADIVKIGEILKEKGMQIASWTCGTDRVESYMKMADRYKEQAGLSDDFEVIEIKRSDEDISATKARQALLDDNKLEFYKLTPQLSLSTRLKNDLFLILRDQILKICKLS